MVLGTEIQTITPQGRETIVKEESGKMGNKERNKERKKEKKKC
jgi:hypothetical protein